MANEIQTLKRTLSSKNIPYSSEWLEACIQWCKEEILRPNYTIDELQSVVHEQWLSLDLRIIKTPILPPKLSEKEHMILDGNYPLQVMQIVDISKPKYWQIQQIRKENILSRPQHKEISDSIGTGKRVLQLTLTDGVQYVEAMEYKPIPVLNLNLTPGIKVRLNGPLTIRRGRMMLQEKNISILGGEVEELLIENAPENILARHLRLPENPNPQTIDVNLLNITEEKEPVRNNSIPNNQNNILKNNNIGNKSINNKNHSNNDSFPTSQDILEVERQVNNKKTKSRVKSPYEEEMQMLMEVEDEFENEMRTTKVNSSKNINKRSNSHLFEDDFDTDNLDIDNIIKSAESTTSSRKIESPTNESVSYSPLAKCSSIDNQFDDFINEDIFDNIDIDEIEKNNSGILKISDLLKNIDRIDSTFKIHGKFKNVIEKFNCKNDEYKLVIKIEDSSNEIICKVHNDVITTWVGLTVKEFTDLVRLCSQNSDSKRKIENVFHNLKNKLLELNHVMEVQTNGKNNQPVIINVL